MKGVANAVWKVSYPADSATCHPADSASILEASVQNESVLVGFWLRVINLIKLCQTETLTALITSANKEIYNFGEKRMVLFGKQLSITPFEKNLSIHNSF